jgi:hypothetical protein
MPGWGRKQELLIAEVGLLKWINAASGGQD